MQGKQPQRQQQQQEKNKNKNRNKNRKNKHKHKNKNKNDDDNNNNNGAHTCATDSRTMLKIKFRGANPILNQIWVKIRDNVSDKRAGYGNTNDKRTQKKKH